MNTDIAAQHALDHLAKSGPEALSEAERTVAAAWLFEAGVGNSGFAAYFSGHRSDLAFAAPEALRAIGAAEMAAIAAEANAIFRPDGPLQELELGERREIVRHLNASARARFSALEQRYENCAEDVDELLERFLAQKK